MRIPLTLLLGACASMGSAQFVNGDFEDGLSGWQLYVSVSSDTVGLSDDVPNGGGLHSLIFHCPGTENTAVEVELFQLLDQVDAGSTVHFGGWMKIATSTSGFDQLPSIAIGTCDSTGCTSKISELEYLSDGPYWWFTEATATLDQAPPPDQSYCICLSSGVEQIPWFRTALFDDLFVQPDASVGAMDLVGDEDPRLHPNPAADKLWIDLLEPGVSITAIDASGRAHDLKNFTHRDRTLEVDVHAIPTGICLLRVTTASGTHAVRFVKA